MSFGLNKFLAPLPGIRQQSFGNSVINLYMSFGLYKFYGAVAGDWRGSFLSLEVGILKNG